ncbi:unnamed protein product [Absidia cylindrospora]
MPPVSPEQIFTRKKQSSLSKLRTTKGKVSTAINVFENDTSTTSQHITSTRNPSRPLSKSIVRLHSYDISLSPTIDTVPQSLSILNGNQLRSESPPPNSKQHGDTEISLHNRLPAITTTPLNSIQASVYSNGNGDKQHYQHQISRSSVLRPRSIYTPQLSQLDSEHSSISPLSMPLVQYTSPIPETSISPQLLNTEPNHYSSPPTPPLQHSRSHKRHTPQKDNSTGQSDALTDILENSIITTTSDNNSQRLYVFDIDNENTKSDSLPHLEIDHLKNADNIDQPQANQQRYSDSHTDSSDDSSALHLSDDTDTDDMSENNNSGNSLNQPLTPLRKRYSDGTYFDHCYDYHINATTTINDTVTTNITQKPVEQQKKVPPSSVETGSSSPQPTAVAANNSLVSTRGFWNAFNAEMGQEQRPDITDSNQQGATNAQQGVKYLPISLSQQQYNSISSINTNSTLPIPSISPPSLALFRRRKSSNKPREKKASLSSSSWWKESSSKKPEPVYHTTVSLGKTPTSSFTTPFVNYAAKIGSKNPTGYRGSSSLIKRMMKAAPIAPAATAQPKWRQRVPVSKHHT